MITVSPEPEVTILNRLHLTLLLNRIMFVVNRLELFSSSLNTTTVTTQEERKSQQNTFLILVKFQIKCSSYQYQCLKICLVSHLES